MKKYLMAILTFTVISLSCMSVFAAAPSGSTKDAVITVPEGQVLHTIVTMPLTSDKLSLGQNVTVVLGENFCYKNKLVAPVDSVVNGKVINVSKATKNSAGELQLRFTRITTPYGIQVPVSAVVKNNSKIGKISGADELFASETRDVNIPVSTPVDLVLIQPITVNPEAYNPNY